MKASTLLQFKNLQWVTQFLLHIYKVHITTQSIERKKYFQQFSQFTELLFKALILMYAGSTCMFFVFPIYVYFSKKELIPMLPLFAPGLDEKTTIGMKKMLSI